MIILMLILMVFISILCSFIVRKVVGESMYKMLKFKHWRRVEYLVVFVQYILTKRMQHKN